MILEMLAVAFIGSPQSGPEPWNRVHLSRAVHAIAYTAPGICPSDNQIALQLWNMSGTEFSRLPKADLGEIVVAVHARDSADRPVPSPASRDITVKGKLDYGMDSIRCIEAPTGGAPGHGYIVDIITATYSLKP